MNEKISRVLQERKYLLHLMEDLSMDQLNEIPEGFHNNIIWNIGHIVVTQQTICYRRADLPLKIDEEYFSAFKPGTKPEKYFDEKEVKLICSVLLSVLESFNTDYENNVFINYTSWTTRYGVNISNIDDAVDFLLYHEGLHTGYIMAEKRLVKA